MKNKRLRLSQVSGVFICVAVILGQCVIADQKIDHDFDRKLDPQIRWLFHQQTDIDRPISSVLKKIDQDIWIDVFVHCSTPEDLHDYDGIRVRSQTDSMAVAWIQLSEIYTIAKVPWILYIRAASPCKPSLDQSIPAIQVNRIRSGELGIAYTGKNILIGIVDYGIDWSNPDFQDEVGNSRILYLWDQTEISIQSPNGVVFTQEEITKEIRGITHNSIPTTDITGHGTHVAGIAAGNGRSTGNNLPSGQYIGVAPEADLIVVKVGHAGFVHDTNISEGIDYILQKADELNRPVAINVSIGQQKGPHDGTSSFEKYIDQLMENPGQILVVAAGNERDAPIHFKHDFQSENEVFEVTFEVECITSLFDYTGFDLWYTPEADLAVSVKTPLDSTYGPVQSLETGNWETDEGEITIDNASGGSYAYNHDFNCWLRISDTQLSGGYIDNLYPGTWTLIFQGQPGGRVDGWLYESSCSSWISSQVDTTTLIAEPGNARNCITVGSYISRNTWPSLAADPWEMNFLTVGALSDFSSSGPTRPNSDNPQYRQKPEVTAPGEYILSALAKEKTISAADHHWIATDSVHWAQRGTSMSAPHMTGVAALLLEAQPDLMVSQIKNLLIRYSKKDQFTGDQTWDLAWGYGKLDAFQLMYVLTSVLNGQSVLPESIQLLSNYPNPFNGRTIICYEIPGIQSDLIPVTIGIYNIRGQLVHQLINTNQPPGHYTVHWNGQDQFGQITASGLYFCIMRTNNQESKRKLVFIQ